MNTDQHTLGYSRALDQEKHKLEGLILKIEELYNLSNKCIQLNDGLQPDENLNAKIPGEHIRNHYKQTKYAKDTFRELIHDSFEIMESAIIDMHTYIDNQEPDTINQKLIERINSIDKILPATKMIYFGSGYATNRYTALEETTLQESMINITERIGLLNNVCQRGRILRNHKNGTALVIEDSESNARNFIKKLSEKYSNIIYVDSIMAAKSVLSKKENNIKKIVTDLDLHRTCGILSKIDGYRILKWLIKKQDAGEVPKDIDVTLCSTLFDKEKYNGIAGFLSHRIKKPLEEAGYIVRSKRDVLESQNI